MQKKAQSALEFLTTYAWAFIVMITVIGVIAYFGVLRPQKILPDRCALTGFDCQAYSIGSGGNIELRLKNGLGQTITVTGITFSAESGTITGCTLASPPSLPYANWAAGNITDFSWTSCNFGGAGLAKGDKIKILPKVDYYDSRAGVQYARVTEGEILLTLI